MENKIAIQLLIEEDLLRQALEEAQKTGKPVGEILNENVRKSFEKNGSSTVASDAEQIPRAAVDRARSLPSKEEFSLGQLCPPSDWRRLSSGERKSLGKRFR